jgi:molecular chaperone DnaK (HSP70)
VEIPVVRVSGVPPRAVPIGKFLLSGFAPARRGRPRIEVSFTVDGSGALRARARDMDGGASQEVTFARGFPEEAGAVPAARAGARGTARLLARAS